MSFRNRPVLDRKHRPRWQDELRTQQLVVAGFALAIALAIGIFGATAWSGFYDANLQQVALVNGVSVDRAQMTKQVNVLGAELTATYVDLSSQLGGARDVILNQQLSAVQGTLQSVESNASDSLITSLMLEPLAAQFGIEPTAADVDAEVASRRNHAERLKLSMILVFPVKAADAPAGAEATPEEWDAAKAKVQGLLDQVNGGADFATLAAANSDDSSKNQNGLLGWIEAGDGLFGDYFDAAGDAAAGALVGPLTNNLGWYILRVDERVAAGPNTLLDEYLAAAGVSDAEFRSYIRAELLRRNARAYFADTVVTRYQPQQKVAQIFLNADQGQPIPKERVRHVLAQPIPGQQDQSTATQEQWDAALARIQELRTELAKPGADWNELAKQSDDSGSASKGGDLGWYDPATMATTFVPEFAAAATALRVGQLSDPVKTDYGYHIIEIVATRTSALGQANDIVQAARQDPGVFGELAMEQSEDTSTAAKGGELGWIAHYQLDAIRDEAIFALTDIGQISDPVVTSNGIYIYKLEDTSPARYVPESQRSQISNSGYTRWLAEIRDRADIWIDPQYASTSTTG